MTAPAGTERVRREVVSFVRRSARMTAGQARAWAAYAERYLVEVPRGATSTSVAPTAPLDLPTIFGRDAPLVVEVGPGHGDSLVPLASARPEVNILAFEVYQPAVASLLARLAEAGVGNVRIVAADAVAGLAVLLRPASVAEVWTFFPDPWPKARHHKRRLITPDLTDLVAERMQPGGRWRLATDWADYAVAMRAVLDAHPGLRNAHAGWAPRWDARPLTRFEERGLAADRPIFDLEYRRR